MNGVRTAAATAHARGEMQEVDEQLGVEEPVSADGGEPALMAGPCMAGQHQPSET